MFSASQLSEEQKTSLHRWAAEGATIADLQNRLKEEWNLGMTYMDARFLVLDLGIEIKPAEEGSEEVGESEKAEGEDPLPEATGSVSVTMDSIAVPGALVSGRVTFSDGQGAIWMLDQQGRPGLDPDTAGYRPNEGDISEFQLQLSELIKQKGL